MTASCFWILLLLHFLQICTCFVPRLGKSSKLCSALQAWSRHAEIVHDSTGLPTCSVSALRNIKLSETTYKVDSPRLWLEYNEKSHGRQGAYTVIRCDFNPWTKTWKLWGEDFHIDRLSNSFRMLEDSPDSNFDWEYLTIAAKKSTECVKDHLLECLSDEFSRNDSEDSEIGSNNDEIILGMLTILWTYQIGQEVKVQGHLFSSGGLVNPLLYQPNFGAASVALESEGEEPLPSRLSNHVMAKTSSWCRRRRPLEERFKSDDTVEVLLTRKTNAGTELLEGLTSNLFIVYHDGTLRTPAEDSCLPGLARSLIMETARNLNLELKVGPILLAESHEWKEVFLSSSIRLVIPLSRIVLSKTKESDNVVPIPIWESKNLQEEEDNLWKQIYTQLF